MRAQPHVAELAKTDGQLARLLQQIGDESKKANDAGFRAVSLLEAYRGTGLLALLASLLSVFTRPRRLCLATLPLGVLSFVQAHVVM